MWIVLETWAEGEVEVKIPSLPHGQFFNRPESRSGWRKGRPKNGVAVMWGDRIARAVDSGKGGSVFLDRAKQELGACWGFVSVQTLCGKLAVGAVYIPYGSKIEFKRDIWAEVEAALEEHGQNGVIVGADFNPGAPGWKMMEVDIERIKLRFDLVYWRPAEATTAGG